MKYQSFASIHYESVKFEYVLNSLKAQVLQIQFLNVKVCSIAVPVKSQFMECSTMCTNVANVIVLKLSIAQEVNLSQPSRLVPSYFF